MMMNAKALISHSRLQRFTVSLIAMSGKKKKKKKIAKIWREDTVAHNCFQQSCATTSLSLSVGKQPHTNLLNQSEPLFWSLKPAWISGLKVVKLREQVCRESSVDPGIAQIKCNSCTSLDCTFTVRNQKPRQWIFHGCFGTLLYPLNFCDAYVQCRGLIYNLTDWLFL